LGGPGSYLGLAAGTNAIILTSSAVVPGGNDTHIQFNKDGVFSGSDNLQFDYDDNELSLCGTFEVKSGSSPATAPIVFEVDGEDGQVGGAVRGRIAQVWSVNFDVTSGGNASAGRFVGLTQNSTAGESTSFNNTTSFLSPFSGRVTKIMFRFPGTYDATAANRPQWQLEIANIEQNGTIANSTTRVIHQATASLAPGQNVVGGIEVYQNAFQVTGSWAWGTGSLVGLKSIIPGGTAYPGMAHLTLLIEFDQLDPYISGSGN
jgi:hypothetical protein